MPKNKPIAIDLAKSVRDMGYEHRDMRTPIAIEFSHRNL